MFLDTSTLSPPRIFISSIMSGEIGVHRTDVVDDLKEFGYEVLDFKEHNFPYTMDNSSPAYMETVAGVRAADVFVVIIGGDCGSIIQEKSVVTMEYNAAIEKNIPVFVFIEAQVWKDFENERIGNHSKIKTDYQYNFIKKLSEQRITTFNSHQECKKHIRSQFNNYLGGLFRFSINSRWLWNEQFSINNESLAKAVWIITPDFYWDFDDHFFRNVVTNNITHNGCEYRYIFKDTRENKERIREMLRYYKQIIRQLKLSVDINKSVLFLPVAEENFFWSCEQIIYNPFALNERAIMVDIMDVRDKTLKFNIEFGRNKRLVFRNQFVAYWNSHSEQKIDLKEYDISDL